jgi:alkanesulfonate monooxygenase SsuD/methylene tetrahydromethanopterin reductase-like flavin-dependent oxidoreductase (luciferase family)
VRTGLTLPIFDGLADPRLLAELAATAEGAGWDGVFVWDHVVYRAPVRAATDAWIATAAMAMRTERVALGALVTPLARRRPQVVARQAVALDHLSGGRLVLGVGLGLDRSGGELSRFGEELDDRRRAAMLDEALDVLAALFAGGPVDHRGEHYTATVDTFLPTPVRGHLPTWVAARWPHRRPIRRAARHDGLFVIDVDVADLPAAIAEVERARPQGLAGYDVVVEVDRAPTRAPGRTPARPGRWCRPRRSTSTSTPCGPSSTGARPGAEAAGRSRRAGQGDQGVRGRSWRTPSITTSARSSKKATSPAMRGHSTTGSG